MEPNREAHYSPPRVGRRIQVRSYLARIAPPISRQQAHTFSANLPEINHDFAAPSSGAIMIPAFPQEQEEFPRRTGKGRRGKQHADDALG